MDFCCLEKKLVIELDGGQHAESMRKDQERTRELQKKGYRIVRIWNNELLARLDDMVEEIARILKPDDQAVCIV